MPAVGRTYTSGGGARIFAGRPAPSNEIVSGVWTPSRGGDGRVLPASWAQLPLNDWVAVAGTEPQTIHDALAAAGFNVPAKTYGTFKNILAVMNAYSGGTLAGPRRTFEMTGGGHFDSSFNGWIHLDLDRLIYGITKMPSDPDAPGFEWSGTYRPNPPSGSFTNYHPDPDDPPDILPDGAPTSRHTYAALAYDPVRNRLCSFQRSLWMLDCATGQYTRQKWTVNSTLYKPGIYGQVYYDEIQDRYVGMLPMTDIDTSTFIDFNPDTGAWVNRGVGNYGGGTATCRIGNKIFMVGNNSGGEKWREFDLETRTASSSTNVNNGYTYNYEQECQACCFVPEWGKVLRRFTANGGNVIRGQWALLDYTTKTNESYAPQGNEPPMSSWPSSKVFYDAVRKAVFYISPHAMNSHSVYVMRVG